MTQSTTKLSRIRRIGCIHVFDNAGSADPIRTVKDTLEKSGQDLSDALIVLPEALDLGNRYGSSNADPVFDISDLKTISRDFNVALVAGLTENSSHPKPYNSALLIDAETESLLSRKVHPDPNTQWYEIGSDGDTRCLDYRGLTLTSLICEDATGSRPTLNQLHKRVLTDLKRGQNGNPLVLCVPARMINYIPSLVARSWPCDISVVIANVKTTNEERPSGIRIANQQWKPCLEGICLELLPLCERN